MKVSAWRLFYRRALDGFGNWLRRLSAPRYHPERHYMRGRRAASGVRAGMSEKDERGRSA